MIKFLILCIQDFKLAIFFKHLYLNIYWFLRWQLYWKILNGFQNRKKHRAKFHKS